MTRYYVLWSTYTRQSEQHLCLATNDAAHGNYVIMALRGSLYMRARNNLKFPPSGARSSMPEIISRLDSAQSGPLHDETASGDAVTVRASDISPDGVSIAHPDTVELPD